MIFITTFVGTVLFSVVFKKPIKRFAIIFYVLALAVSILYLASFYNWITVNLHPLYSLIMQKGILGMAFMVIVMFIGVFREESRVRKYLMPIRGELSIIGSLLLIVHIVRRLTNYITIVFYGAAASTHIVAAFWISLTIFILLLLLAVTSFNVIRKLMDARFWKRLQTLAYPFFILVYAHIMLFLFPAALAGGSTAKESVIVYTVVFVAYGVLRIWAQLIKIKTRKISLNIEEALST